jgi:hypothetical protein
MTTETAPYGEWPSPITGADVARHGFRKAETIVASLEAELSFYGQIMGFVPPDVPPVPLAGD